MTSKQKKMLYRIITAFVLFVVLMVLEHTGVLEQLPSQWLVFHDLNCDRWNCNVLRLY